MFDERSLLEMIAASTPEQCREMGKLFLSFADDPRDVHWRASFAEKLASLPDTPETSLAARIRASRARVAADQDALRATGWHPDQMRAELEARGYQGASPEAAIID